MLRLPAYGLGHACAWPVGPPSTWYFSSGSKGSVLRQPFSARPSSACSWKGATDGGRAGAASHAGVAQPTPSPATSLQWEVLLSILVCMPLMVAFNQDKMFRAKVAFGPPSQAPHLTLMAGCRPRSTAHCRHAVSSAVNSSMSACVTGAAAREHGACARTPIKEGPAVSRRRCAGCGPCMGRLQDCPRRCVSGCPAHLSGWQGPCGSSTRAPRWR